MIDTKINKKKHVKILIQRCDRIGDMVFTFPLIDQLRELYQECQIDYIASKEGRLALLEYGYINIIYVADTTNLAGSIKSFMKDIKHVGYDIFISLWNHEHLNKVGYYAKIPKRIGYAQSWLNKRLFTHVIRQPWPDLTLHAVEHNLSMLSAFEKPIKLARANLSQKKYKENAYTKKLEALTKQTILIFTETGGSNIPFPVDVIKEFIHEIRKENQYHIVLAGKQYAKKFGEDDQDLVTNLIGKTTFTELIACIAACDYYIGPDTGPTHFASFLNKPMIFFSPLKSNPPSIYGPLTTQQCIIRQDYTFEKLHITSSDYPKLLEYLNGSLLMKAFKTLQDKTNILHTYNDIKTYHLLQTYRILYFPYKHESLTQIKDRCKDLQQKGLYVFPIKKRSLIAIIKQMKWRNSNVFQGAVPWWIRLSVHVYMGSIAQFLQPISVSGTILEESIEKLLDKYAKEFKKRLKA